MKATRKAWQLRNRASDQERFFIDFSYYKLVTGDIEKANQICQLWAQTYPRDGRPHGFLGSSTSTAFGRFEAAEQECKKCLELQPGSAMVLANLAAAYLYLNRLADARVILRQSSEHNLEISETLYTRYLIAFLEADKPDMERVAALTRTRSDMNDWMPYLESSVLAYSGHLRQARSMSARALEIARQAGHRDSAAQYEAGAAVREALFGNVEEARGRAASVHTYSTNRDAQYGAALARALAGDSNGAQPLADDLASRFPDDTQVKFSYLPVLRASLALNRHEPGKALELLQAAAPYELGWLGSGSVGFIGSLYPIYVRGQAYLAANQGAEAAAEFQKILDHRGIVGAGIIGAMARLQLGRAFARAGNYARAKSAYQDFLTLWKDADPDIPIFKEAKTEYARLQ